MMVKPFSTASFLSLLIWFSSAVFGQELDCEITVNYESIPTSHREYLVEFADVVKKYMNDHRWTDDEFRDERIQCTFNIFFLSVSGDNSYSAQVFIGSQRPIYRTERSTGVVRIFDDKWNFTYTEDQPIYHDLFEFDPIASFLDFYGYVILGYDYDTYEPMAGTPFHDKALDIVRLGQSGTGSRGWKRATSGVYSRAVLIDELLSANFQLFRGGLFRYHVEGLDLLNSDPDRARKNIARVMEDLVKVRKQLNERSLALKIFFDTKYQEIAEVLAGYVDRSLFERLGEIDPTHQSTYQEYKDKVP
ncbi:MAG: DUF4835 family protein [Bacteroidota bacterium]